MRASFPRRTVLLCALVGFAGTAAATAEANGKVLPKGTPYAAEVKVTITGTAKVTELTASRTENVCEDQPAVENERRIGLVAWQATFPQVTVPVADANELGQAYKRLHVKVTPTSTGDGGLTSGAYQDDGSASTSSCGNVDYGTIATLKGDQFDPFSDEKVLDVGGAKRSVFGFVLGGIGTASPATLDPNTPGDLDVVREADGLFGRLPDTAVDDFINNPPPEWNTVALDEPTHVFAALKHQPTITIPETDSGTQDCAGPPEDPSIGTASCSLTRNITYSVKIERRMLYKTVRDYPR